ncbi:unnamed protein product [Rotaria socialis]
MTTPHPHIQVTRLSRMGRRRSQSVTLPNANVRGQTSSDPALDQHREAANVVSDTSIVNINQNVINDKHIDTNSQTSSFRHAPVPVPTGFTTSLNISYYKYQVNLSDHEYHCPESQKCDSEFKCQNFDFFQISVGRYKN